MMDVPEYYEEKSSLESSCGRAIEKFIVTV